MLSEFNVSKEQPTVREIAFNEFMQRIADSLREASHYSDQEKFVRYFENLRKVAEISKVQESLEFVLNTLQEVAKLE